MNLDARESKRIAATAAAESARAYLEDLRWPNGAVCPHCGSLDASWRVRRSRAESSRVPGGALWKCAVCRRQFTATVGTMLENSKIPAEKWLMAFDLLCRDGAGVPSGRLARELELTHKSALSMCRRIRYALGIHPLRSLWAAAARARAKELAASPKRNSREIERLRSMLAAARKRPASGSPVLPPVPPGMASLSLWPMAPAEAMAAFLRVNPRSLPGD